MKNKLSNQNVSPHRSKPLLNVWLPALSFISCRWLKCRAYLSEEYLFWKYVWSVRNEPSGIVPCLSNGWYFAIGLWSVIGCLCYACLFVQWLYHKLLFLL